MAGLQHDPAWGSNGQALYFLSGSESQAHDIWRAELGPAGTGAASLSQLTAGERYHFDAAPGPDGAIAFSANRSGNYELWVQRPGIAPRQLTNHPALDARPSWSPSGDALAFESSRGGTLQVWRVSIDGGEPVQLTQHPEGARMPVWFREARP